MEKNKIQFTKDDVSKKITVTRNFDAPCHDVWRAWTERDLLDQWWAPKPWRAETSTMDFRAGGHWLYAMVGPNQERHWARMDYKAISPEKKFVANECFCDEKGKMLNDQPKMDWTCTFEAMGDTTTVTTEIKFPSDKDMQTILVMGFEEGFTMALGNLEHYFSTHFKLRREAKTNNHPRVTTYLNFNGNTEEAFTFYKKVFRGEFTGKKLQRFGDIEMPEGHPPMSDADKKLIIHAELTILGGHVLMATDAPESMGFKLQTGNNMHICLEPASREETERLFKELAAGGNVTMPLADMFFGAYFAEFTDKYGISWMLNYQAAG